MSDDASATLRHRLRAREPLVGTFVKTPAPQVVEVLARADLDFVVLDAEHAPWGASELDLGLLAARAAALPAWVRVPEARGFPIQQALDLGACGVLVPHVASSATARAMAAAVRYRGGRRGYSNSPRAGGYGRIDMASHLLSQDSAAAVICQVESAEAVAVASELAALPEVDGLFIGRADLAVSLGCDRLDAPEVAEAVSQVLAAANAHNKAVGLFLGHPDEAAGYRQAGASFFIIGSDQSLLSAAALGLGRARGNSQH